MNIQKTKTKPKKKNEAAVALGKLRFKSPKDASAHAKMRALKRWNKLNNDGKES